jgi:hypothetical protein
MSDADRAAKSLAGAWWSHQAPTGLFVDVAKLNRVFAPYQQILNHVDQTRALGEALQRASGVTRAQAITRALGATTMLDASRIAHLGAAAQLTQSTNLARLFQQVAKPPNLVLPAMALPGHWQQLIQTVTRSMDWVVEAGRGLDEDTDRFVARHGWPVPTSLPIRAYRNIVRMHDQPRRLVNAMMVDTFGPHSRLGFGIVRRGLLDSDVLGSRRPTVRQAIKSAKLNLWYPTIAALLPLIEGTLVDVAYANDRPVRSNPRAALDELRTVEELAFTSTVETLETILLAQAAGAAIFDRFDPRRYGVPGEPRSLNRHAILHGSARRYGTERNAVKLMLVLVLMAEVLDKRDD